MASQRLGVTQLVRMVRKELKNRADPLKAPAMSKYVKERKNTFLGLQRKDRDEVFRMIKNQFKPESQAEYELAVDKLWSLPHREEKYAGIFVARHYAKPKEYDPVSLLLLYERMVTEGAWWDFVDEIASAIIGPLYLHQRSKVRDTVIQWNSNSDMWLRRTSLLASLKHKKETDWQLLSKLCLNLMHEDEFFIRKAVGWVLREYAKADPSAVKEFSIKHRDKMSYLSYKEATKYLNMGEHTAVAGARGRKRTRQEQSEDHDE